MILMLIIGVNVHRSKKGKSHYRKMLSMTFLGVLGLSNLYSLGLIMMHILGHGGAVDGHVLILSSISIYLTNIVVFGLLYWEIDCIGFSGDKNEEEVNFLFPQMTVDAKITKQPNWTATFIDYLFLSVTNSTAFSPTDTLPLTHKMKILMTIQTYISFGTIIFVAARAVNIL